MTLHNYRSRQVHETLNGVNPSSSFRDMRSAKSGPNLWQIWQVFGPWASPYGANGHMTMTVHTYRPRQFHRTSNGENPSSGYRDMGSASLAAARPPARTVTTIPLQPGGLRGKKVWRTDVRTDWTIHRAAKNANMFFCLLMINPSQQELTYWERLGQCPCNCQCHGPWPHPSPCCQCPGSFCTSWSAAMGLFSDP